MNESSGATTPLASLITGTLVLATLVLLAPLFSHLPKAVLAAIRSVLPVGQVMGLLHDEPTVAELMERMVAEAKKQQQKLDAHFA